MPDSADQVLHGEMPHEVSQFKTSITASNIGQEAGVQESEGINKEDSAIKKVVTRHSTG